MTAMSSPTRFKKALLKDIPCQASSLCSSQVCCSTDPLFSPSNPLLHTHSTHAPMSSMKTSCGMAEQARSRKDWSCCRTRSAPSASSSTKLKPLFRPLLDPATTTEDAACHRETECRPLLQVESSTSRQRHRELRATSLSQPTDHIQHTTCLPLLKRDSQDLWPKPCCEIP